GHFFDFDSPEELLLEQGALLTLRATADDDRGRFPADLLLENGQMLMFSSAPALTPLVVPLTFFFSRFFSFGVGLSV
ncbi:hypothetical protein ABTG52_14245, partial [Acinetobacter baumannii]